MHMNYTIEPMNNHNAQAGIFFPAKDKKDIVHFEEDDDDGGWLVSEPLHSVSADFQKITQGSNIILTIIDPYFLGKQGNLLNYLSKFMDIIGLLTKYTAIHIVCAAQHEDTRKAFDTMLGALLSVQIVADVQDRFWLTNKGLGLVCGTSFLGLEDIPPMIYLIKGDKYNKLYRVLKRKYQIKI